MNRTPLTLIITLTLLAACAAPQTHTTTRSPQTTQHPPKPTPPPQTPPVALTQPPILAIDTGGHKATIRDVMFTKDGRRLVSVSDDKTIRVWDAATGEIDRVIRGQIGEGDEGKIYAAALSPDNRWLAVGGWMEHDEIRLIDFHTGEIKRLLKGHENVVNGLAFSPDGQKLISGSADKTARIWDVATGRALHTLSGHAKRIYAVAFSPDSQRAVTGCDDHTLRLWDVQTGREKGVLTGHEDKVQSAAFTPDGQYLLSGSDDKTIRLWDGKTGRFVKVLANLEKRVDGLAISPDGKQLIVGNAAQYGPFKCHIFSIPSGQKRLSFTRHDNIVLATAISPDGALAATGGGSEKEIYLWDARTGAVRHKLVGKGNSVWSVGFGKDGRTIAWGKTWEKRDLLAQGGLEQSFRFKEPGEGFKLSFGERLTGDQGFVRGIDAVGDVSIKTKNGDIHPTLQILKNGQVAHEITRGSTDGQDHRCLTLTPDGNTAISGGAWGVLTSYDTHTGAKRHDFIGHTAVIWGVAVSPDGKRLVSGAADQTVRLWDMASGRNLLTIFHGSDGEWVAWTPEGYYDSSLKGDQYIGWHINQGPDRSALYYPASQFAGKFRKPRVVAAYLETNGDLDRALALAEKRKPGRQRVERTEADDIVQALPPKIYFTDPQTDLETGDDRVCVSAGAESLTAAPVTDIWFVLNGSQTRVIKRRKNGMDPRQTLNGRTAAIEQCFHLSEGRNQIALFAATRDGKSQPEILKVFRTTEPEPQEDIFKPDLYLLSVGVSRYANPAYNLSVAHKDAQAVADAFRQQEGRLYKKIHVNLLTDAQATADNVLDGLDWILRESTQNDLSVIFVAGHGENDAGNNYYFIPHDGELDRLRRTAVRWYDFQDVVSRLPSKTLLMVDTCRSGNITGTRRRGGADVTEALRDLMQASPGVMVMAASTGREVSIERPEWGHGAFTKALVEGLRDFKADYDNNRSLDIKELDLYITQRVKELTDGQQHATTEIPKIMPNFPIAVR